PLSGLAILDSPVVRRRNSVPPSILPGAAPARPSMPHLEVVPVESRRQRKLFFNLPWELYRGDPNWVPPLRNVQKELLNFRHHPFYDNADNRNFLALVDGTPVGRINAIINHAHNDWYKEKRGFFGFFES